jgi:hypothetical protein
VSREPRDEKAHHPIRAIGLFLLSVVSGFSATAASAGEIVFLQDGRTVRAEKAEIVGDRVRLETPAETIELPRSTVLSIHRLSSPAAAPGAPPPAEVYRDMTQQMADKIRRELGGPLGGPRGR